MTNQIHELLTKGRQLITPPENWTQGEYARDKEQIGCNPTFKQATCFCSAGALYHIVDASPGSLNRLVSLGLNHLANAMGVDPCQVFVFNDDHTHEEVLAAWDKAIEAVAA